MKCPKCGTRIKDDEIARHFAAKGGASKSEAKQAAARLNGKKGGRPRKAAPNADPW
jgi:hypothetical protein